MTDANGNGQTNLDLAWAEIRELGLESYVADLDAHGYTIVPPAIATPNGLAERMLEAALDVSERRNGVRADLENGSTHAGFKGRFASFAPEDGDSPIGDLMQSLLFEDRVFEEALMNRVLLAMATYLCGYSVVLSSMGCFMKGPNRSTFSLHSDTPLPAPLPPQALVCNMTYVLTDFNRENGSTAFVPGSHKWCRNPHRARGHRRGRRQRAGRRRRMPRRVAPRLARQHLARSLQPDSAGAARQRTGLHVAPRSSARRKA